MIAAPVMPAWSPSRLATSRRSRVASGSERWKNALSHAGEKLLGLGEGSADHDHAGLKRLTQPRAPPEVRPAWRTSRVAVPDRPSRTRLTTSRALARVEAAPQPLGQRLAAGDRLQAAELPQRQRTSSCRRLGYGRCRRPLPRAAVERPPEMIPQPMPVATFTKSRWSKWRQCTRARRGP